MLKMRIYRSLVFLLYCFVGGIYSNKSQEQDKGMLDRAGYFNTNQCDIQWKEIKANSEKYLRIFDSWGRFPAGLLKGHTQSLGHFQECLETEIEFKDLPRAGVFRGQYCLALIPFKSSFSSSLASRNKTSKIPYNFQIDKTKIELGVCVPEACSEAEISSKLGLDLRNGSCSTNNQYRFEAVDYIAIAIFSTVGILIVAGTICDFYWKQENLGSELMQTILAFSLRTNVRKLIKIPKKSPSSVECLNGLRIFTMFWVIFGHIYMFNFGLPLVDYDDLTKWRKTPFSMILQASVSVDTFLFISGFLIVWLGLLNMELQKGKLNILSTYFHRYVRLTPALAAAILMVVSLEKFMGNGPYWDNFLYFHKKGCDEYWWSTLLYIQNYLNPRNMCLAHSWYLAVDTQLHILSPFILIGLWKWNKRFYLAIITLSALSIGCVFTTFHIEGLKKVVGFSEGRRPELIYFPTHTRCTSWLIGAVVGHIFFSYRYSNVKLPKWANILGWSVCLATLLAVIFGPNHTKAPEYESSITEAALYEIFSRLSWCIAISWIVFACQYGYGGFINSILSLRIWIPFGRLTYCMYIVHFVVQTTIFGNIKTDISFSNFNSIQEFWSCLGLTFCTAVVFVLAFESPVISLEKIFLKKLSNRSPTIPNKTSKNILSA